MKHKPYAYIGAIAVLVLILVGVTDWRIDYASLMRRYPPTCGALGSTAHDSWTMRPTLAGFWFEVSDDYGSRAVGTISYFGVVHQEAMTPHSCGL